MKKVLVIFPHPDDETFATGGTIAQHAANGDKVTYLCLTDGQNGRNLGNPVIANRQTLPYIRRRELSKACEALGVHKLISAGLYDKLLEFMPIVEGVERITQIIVSEQPDLIYTFYPGYSVHPDHDITGEWVVKALKQMPTEKRPALLTVAFSRNAYNEIGQPTYINDVSDVFEAKRNALLAHGSQTAEAIATIDEKLHNKDSGTYDWIMREKFWEISL
ncbi:MAG: bacillithiol biosynthesis deacetylase BshB2 [Bacilli bacterium]